MNFYVYQLNETTLITHDGYIQLGLFNMSMSEFMKQAKVEYTETYWLPDTFSNRYKRASFQKHLQSASIGTKTE